MNKYKKSYLISSFEVDVQQKLRIHSLFNLFQDLADEHAEKIGVGYTFCAQNNLGWVGGAYHIEINRLPTWGEHVTIETWPSATTAASAIRDFQMTDEKGEVLVSATSQWVLIDTTRLRPLPVAKHLPHYELVDDRALLSDFSKIANPTGTATTLSFPVHVDDIDLNRHVNNALYPTWALDGLDDNFRLKNSLSELKITFKRSAKFGDTLTLDTYRDDLEVVSVLSNPDKTVEFARIWMKWQQNNE